MDLEGSRVGVLNIYAPTDLQAEGFLLADIGRIDPQNGLLDFWRRLQTLRR